MYRTLSPGPNTRLLTPCMLFFFEILLRYIGPIHATSTGLSVSLSLSADELPVLGGDITLVCKSTPTSEGSFHRVIWKYKSSNLPQFCHNKSCTDEPLSLKYKLSSDGIAVGNLTIKSLTLSDDGIYQCKVVNEYGIEWSNELDLTSLTPSEYSLTLIPK